MVAILAERLASGRVFVDFLCQFWAKWASNWWFELLKAVRISLWILIDLKLGTIAFPILARWPRSPDLESHQSQMQPPSMQGSTNCISLHITRGSLWHLVANVEWVDQNIGGVKICVFQKTSVQIWFMKLELLAPILLSGAPGPSTERGLALGALEL
jgi:hypothetical protein